MFNEDVIKHKSVEAYFKWVLEELGETDYCLNIREINYGRGFVINFELSKITMRDILIFTGLKYQDGELGYEGKAQIAFFDKLKYIVDKEAEKLYQEDNRRLELEWGEQCTRLVEEQEDYSKYDRYNKLREVLAELEDGTDAYNITVEFGNGLTLPLQDFEYGIKSDIKYTVKEELEQSFPDINFGKPEKSKLWDGRLEDMSALSWACGITIKKRVRYFD